MNSGHDELNDDSSTHDHKAFKFTIEGGKVTAVLSLKTVCWNRIDRGRRQRNLHGGWNPSRAYRSQAFWHGNNPLCGCGRRWSLLASEGFCYRCSLRGLGSRRKLWFRCIHHAGRCHTRPNQLGRCQCAELAARNPGDFSSPPPSLLI